VNATPIARVENQKIKMLIDEYQKRDPSKKIMLKPEFEEKVALIKFYPGMNSAILQFYTEKKYRGVILEGTGLGHVSNHFHDAIKRAVEQGVVVAMTSQCIWGRINMNVYDSGRDLQALGVIPLEDMLPETALVKMMWVLGQTKDGKKAEELLKANIAGELSPRTLADNVSCE
jgi:glutamyl-tRNA(Gln) amidotransferase subunit D